MADGWRNRFMAPVYALVISFAFVVILGVVLGDPTRIQFVIAGQNGSSEPAEDFPALDVQVKTVTDTKQLAGKQLGGSQEFTLLTPYDNIRICTKLSGGWFSEDAKVDASGDSCWDRLTLGKDVVITLDRRKG